MSNFEKMDAVYDAKTLGTPKVLVLGLQHMFAMFGATVLVPAITGLNVSTTLLCAGLGTLLFHIITGMKVPAFLGSSFAFLSAYGLVTASGQEIPLTYSCFGVAVAGLMYLVLAWFFKIFGTAKVMRFFPPIVTGPVIIAIAPISLATIVEHVGDVCAISSTVGKNYVEDPGLHRTLIGDGLATALSALLGGPANTTYGENTGVLALSKVYDPKVVRLAALFAIVLSFCPKFAALIVAMPTATMGGVSLVLYGMISSVGVRNVVENQVDFTKSRNVLIAAMILVLAIGLKYGTGDVGGIVFMVGNVNIMLSGLAIAALAGILMNAVLPGKDYEFGTNQKGDSSVNFGPRHD